MILNLAYSNRSIKHNKSVSYYIAFIIIIIMYFIFFNANSILPDKSTVMNTPLGQELNAGSTKLSINRWEYNKNKNFMEVELAYNDSTDYITTKLNFSAKPKINVKEKLAVKTMLNTDNVYIIRIENIPKNYEAIALKVTQSSSIDTSTDADASNISTDDFNSSTVNNNLSNDNKQSITSNAVTLYCDYRKVKINNSIKSESNKDYIINITKSEIVNINKDIGTINNSTLNNQNLINMVNEKIDNLNGQLKYEIQSEQTVTQQEIASCKANIVNNEQQNATLQNTKTLLEEKIKMLNQKVKDNETLKSEPSLAPKVTTDTSNVRVDNISILLQLQEKQLKQSTYNNIYQDNYKSFMAEVEKENNIQEIEKNKLAIQEKKNKIKKMAKIAHDKKIKKVVKKK